MYVGMMCVLVGHGKHSLCGSNATDIIHSDGNKTNMKDKKE